jgi:integrase
VGRPQVYLAPITVPQKLPFIPTEREIDDLIAASSKYIGAFLQLCKETGATSGEVARIKWTDIDFEHKTARVTPEKRSNPRICRLSDKAVQMINQIPRRHPMLLLGHYKNMNTLRRSFQKQRKEIAAKMGNQHLMQIHFHTLRHWKGTMEYYLTKDILHVMQVLGHKRIQNTLKYTQLVSCEAVDAYICKVAETKEEISGLIEAGFEYICENNGLKFFRKRK